MTSSFVCLLLCVYFAQTFYVSTLWKRAQVSSQRFSRIFDELSGQNGFPLMPIFLEQIWTSFKHVRNLKFPLCLILKDQSLSYFNGMMKPCSNIFLCLKNYFFPTLKKIKVQVQEEGFYQGLSEMERWPWQEGNWERPQSNQEILHCCSCDLPHPTAIVAKTSKEGTNYSFNMSKRPLFFILLPLFFA